MRVKTLEGICSVVLLLVVAACGGDDDGGVVDPGTGFSQGEGFNGDVRELAPATDGSGDVYVGGFFTSYNGTEVNYLVRLNADGTLDVDLGADILNGLLNTVALATDGSGDVYAGGHFDYFLAPSYVLRLNADATLDTAFAPTCNKFVQVIEPATDGSGDVYVGGEFGFCGAAVVSRLARIDANGAVDADFDVGAGFDDIVWTIAPATNDSSDVYVGGFFTTFNGAAANYIVRLNADGTRDTGFDIGVGFNNIVYTIAPATDGSGDVYVGGGFTAYHGIVGPRGIVRLNADGTQDTGFDFGTGFDDVVFAIAPASDGSGDIYVGGFFTSYNGATAMRIVRLNADGSVDPGFVTGTGFDDTVRSIALAVDGSGDVFVGGQFTSYDGTPAGRIARLDATGTID